MPRNDAAEARSIYAEFRAQPGSAQMASLYAIEGLLWWIHRQHPAWVLEVGAGIGTLTYTALTTAPSVIALESDPGCLQALHLRWPECTSPASQGVGQDRIRLRVKPREWVPPLGDVVPFMIVDGPVEHVPQLARRATVFFEGGRRDARILLEGILHTRGRQYVSATWRPADRSKGYTVYLIDPTMWDRWWFRLVRWRESVRDQRGRFFGYVVGKARADNAGG